MKKIHWSDAKEGDKVFDTKVGKFGTLIKFGQSGNYDIHYIDFGNGLRKVKPMLDSLEQRYLYYADKVNNVKQNKINNSIKEEKQIYKNKEDFREKNCYVCGSQLCAGPNDELSDGCHYFRNAIFEDGSKSI